MRSFLSAVLTLVAMGAVVLAVPSLWASQRIVDSDGFASTIAPIAADPEVRDFMAAEITAGVVTRTGDENAAVLVSPLVTAYTQSPQFEADFVDIAGQQHAWLFEEAPPGSDTGAMELDITGIVNRMIGDAGLPVTVDGPVLVPIGSGGGTELEAGRYHQTGQDVTRLGYLAGVIAVIAAVGALVIARRRGTVVIWLGVGAVLAAAVSWAVSVFVSRRAEQEIDGAQGAGRRVADLVIDGVVADFQQAAMITAGVGVVVVVVGVIVRVAGR